MRIGTFFPKWDIELVGDFHNEDFPEMAHIVCDHSFGICLDDIVEPDEVISYVIDNDGVIISDDDSELHSLSAILSELDSFPTWR